MTMSTVKESLDEKVLQIFTTKKYVLEVTSV